MLRRYEYFEDIKQKLNIRKWFSNVYQIIEINYDYRSHGQF